MLNNVIEIKNVSVFYGEHTALDNVTLSVGQNDFLGIIGPNGAGKTTLLKVILGMLKPDIGKISVLGHPPRESRKYIGYIL